MGTKIAIAFANLYSDRVNKLVLMSGKSEPTPNTAILHKLNALLTAANVDQTTIGEIAACWLYSSNFMSKPEFKSILVASQEQAKTFSLIGRKGQIAANQVDLTEQLKSIKAETLVMAGDEDILIFPKQTKTLADNMSNAKFVLLENCAHMPQIEKPNELAQVIVEFLSCH